MAEVTMSMEEYLALLNGTPSANAPLPSPVVEQEKPKTPPKKSISEILEELRVPQEEKKRTLSRLFSSPRQGCRACMAEIEQMKPRTKVLKQILTELRGLRKDFKK